MEDLRFRAFSPDTHGMKRIRVFFKEVLEKINLSISDILHKLIFIYNFDASEKRGESCDSEAKGSIFYIYVQNILFVLFRITLHVVVSSY